MINLNVRVNKEFYYKIKEHKLKLEKERKTKYSWEEYLKIIFGMARN